MGTPDEQLARSYSFEIRPTNHSLLPSMDHFSPAVRYPIIQRNLREEIPMEKPLRASTSANGLVNSSMISSQVSLPNRKVISHLLSKIVLPMNIEKKEKNDCDRSRR